MCFYYIHFLLYNSKFNGHGEPYKMVIKGDAWFGSVKAAAALADEGTEAVLQVKTDHSLLQKKFIKDALSGSSGGVHIVLRGRHPSGKLLIALGYCYLSKKIYFLS